MDGDNNAFIVVLFLFTAALLYFPHASKQKKIKKLAKQRWDYSIEKIDREEKNKVRMRNALSNMDRVEGAMLIEDMKGSNPSDFDYESKLVRAKKSMYIPTKEEIKERRKTEKLEFEKREAINKAELLLKKIELYPLESPVDKTGDTGRFMDFKEQLDKRKLSYKYLYLVRIKSKIDDKKLIKIGITSNEDIEKRFEDDDVVELIEIIKCVKLETKTAMALEYSLIMKYRPDDYFAEDEFDEFSRFDGYTEIIPMKHTTKVCKEIDAVLDDSENIATAFQLIG